MGEVNISHAIYGKLAGDTTLNSMLAAPPTGSTHSIYPWQAPDKAQFPFVIFNLQSGIREYAFKGRALDNEIWQIKGIARVGDSSSQSADDVAGAIADRLDALLTDGTLSISGATASYWRFEGPVRYTETPMGQPRLIHSGGMFRLIYN